MRILLANKFYYRRGGAEVYHIELEKLLKADGHQVATFSMEHPENIESDYSSYFPSEIDFLKKSFKDVSKAILRPIYSKEVKSKFTKIVKDFKPDIVHFNNIHSQLSPLIAKIAYKNNIPIVWTIHDFKLLCPRYDCMRNHKPCELCFDNKWNVVKYKCMKNSLPASLIAYFEAIKWNSKLMDKFTNLFICPSRFIMHKLIQGNFSKEKIVHLHNFIDVGKLDSSIKEKGDYFSYVGRISEEKGIETLLKVAINKPYKLKVVGTGPLVDKFKDKYKADNIEFLGHRSWEEVKEIVGKSMFSVLPSEWYENNPLSVIESLCLGTPVLGANIGGIPELINEQENGFLFESGNLSDLNEKLDQIFSFSSNFNYEKIASIAKEKFSAATYYKKIVKLYDSILGS